MFAGADPDPGTGSSGLSRAAGAVALRRSCRLPSCVVPGLLGAFALGYFVRGNRQAPARDAAAGGRRSRAVRAGPEGRRDGGEAWTNSGRSCDARPAGSAQRAESDAGAGSARGRACTVAPALQPGSAGPRPARAGACTELGQATPAQPVTDQTRGSRPGPHCGAPRRPVLAVAGGGDAQRAMARPHAADARRGAVRQATSCASCRTATNVAREEVTLTPQDASRTIDARLEAKARGGASLRPSTPEPAVPPRPAEPPTGPGAARRHHRFALRGLAAARRDRHCRRQDHGADAAHPDGRGDRPARRPDRDDREEVVDDGDAASPPGQMERVTGSLEDQRIEDESNTGAGKRDLVRGGRGGSSR